MIARAKMIAHVSGYYSKFPALSASDPSTIEAALAYLSKDYVLRAKMNDRPGVGELTGRGLLEIMADRNDKVGRSHMTHNQAPFYWIVDEDALMMGGYVLEQLIDPKTGNSKQDFHLFCHLKFRDEPDGLKIAVEHMAELPTNFAETCFHRDRL